MLIADDDPVTRRVMQDHLTSWGYSVITADDGSRAWSILAQNDAPPLVLLDWMMPGISGLELCRRVRAREELHPSYMIMLTAKRDPEDIVEALEAGADDYITKPFDPRELRARVNVARRIVSMQYRIGLQDVQIDRFAFYDPLTELPNRVLFNERLDRAVQRAKRREDYRFAVLFLDLNRFKLINDGYGHSVGDQMLVHVADRLRTCLRSVDTVARFGSDEFAILLEELASDDDAIDVARRIHDTLGPPVTIDERSIYISASIGIAFDGGTVAEAGEILRHADTALTLGKLEGGLNHVIYSAEMHENVLHRLQLETDLRRAVDEQEFEVHYQPILRLDDGQVAGYEALVRWARHADRLEFPDTFIPVAEETDVIAAIDGWVMREACRRAATWQAAHPEDPPFVCVNLSSRNLRNADLPDEVARTLNETGLAPTQLRLELSERLLIDNTAATMELLARLKRLGVQLFLDDFGVGYSSLSYLHRLPIDVVKIDRAFVRDLLGGTPRVELVQAITALAHSLDLGVVAEGIESAEQAETLRAFGCRWGQGYLYAPALPAEEAEAWAAQRRTAAAQT